MLKDPDVAARLNAVRDHPGRVLAYFVPIDYTMQGMITDTGEEWKLFARHTTVRCALASDLRTSTGAA